MTASFAVPQLPGSLPAEVTTFVGRRFERSTIRELLSEFRLVTLTGFGGIGKTRLAMRMASELRRAFPDGVGFVPLGDLSEADGVPDQVAGALGLHGRSTQSGTIAVVEYLRERTLLLVLDNCEHVVDSAAFIADALLRNCPNVRILATSREPLRVDGEVVHAVSSLTCPSAIESGADGLQHYEAVQLFVDRARASVPGFVLSDSNRDPVATICQKLEGIPLAIELAAARLASLSPWELERGLTDQWELLSRGRRTAPHRQSTVAACVEWSFDLCTPAERKLWAQAAVFVDGFEYDAAAAVCSDHGEGEPIAETLASLVEKSVLAATRGESITRFRMLPPIRARGLAELERSDEAEDQRRRHRDFFLDLVKEAHDGWFSASQLQWIDRVRREVANIAEALELCAAEPTSVGPGLRACSQLVEFIPVLGLFRQGRRWCDLLLAAPSGDPTARALGLRASSWLAMAQGDVESAQTLVAEGQALADPLGGETMLLLTQAAGLVAMYAGRLDEAEHLFGETLQGFTASGNAAESAHCWMLLAIVSAMRGDADRALACQRACLAMTEPVGETWLRSWSLWAAGLAEWTRGDSESGQRLLKECLRLEQLMAETVGIGTVIETMAWIVAANEPKRAVMLMGAAQNERDRIETSINELPGLDVRHRDSMDAARDILGEEAFDHAWSEGRSLDQASAIALCLGEEPGRGAIAGARSTTKEILTRRERQIAELIHQGLSNKEIANSLVISRRTAETHVEHILVKLGFTSRTQVAGWVGEQPTGWDDQ
jgi:serine/threonine-protein kinase PknK